MGHYEWGSYIFNNDVDNFNQWSRVEDLMYSRHHFLKTVMPKFSLSYGDLNTLIDDVKVNDSLN